jgi:elongation factor P hydroxylase
MVRVKRRKHTYWHQLAKFLILNGFKPTEIGKIIQDVFPQCDVNGRHVGAYKRRLIQDEDIIIPAKKTMPLNEVKQMAEGLVTNEDMFIYRCVVGSANRSLKCFEYKFRHEDKDLVSEVEEWITKIQ